jgi:uncharacterized membrane protein
MWSAEPVLLLWHIGAPDVSNVTHHRLRIFSFPPPVCLAFAGAVLAFDNRVTHLLRELTRFLPDQDTVTEVLIVLGIVIMIFVFSKTDNLQRITRQVAPYPSEASPAITQK